ncbi:amidohydrolase family protein [Jannaschia seohaensis]|uniref:Enamidase n=1 Tax=Jannaschia seohaensis TaxID=475081 RepID=A0A2Y9ABM8_9RHOB|nr:amidohydrolase family protein [Jannaschia seohaensis]PWJ21280.1 enamidase [Jannaschia seohaensis]SSA41690.1 enamidase [Jannaschia seohaensis]
MAKLVIRNIGSILSGRIEEPRLDGDTLIAVDGRITEWGSDLDTEGADVTVDANGVTLCPGLIDSHVHPVVGDYTPRQQQLHWIDSTLHGGVTTIISAGEVHMPGRPNDPVGTVAMAIAAQRWYDNLRPSGMKVHAGAPLLQKGLERHHFEQMAEAGVRLIGEVGLGTVKDGTTANEMIGWARELGMKSTIHTGGPSIPGSGLIDADMVLETGTDVVGHINGGHSALPDDQICRICEHATAALEIVHNGNERAALLTLKTAQELGKLDQIILGTDGPAGSGVQPLGILRMVAMLSSLGDVPAEIAFCFATGNTARRRELDVGMIEAGRAADFVLMDQAQHAPGADLLESVKLGNLPGVGMTIIDGKVTSMRSRNTPPATRLPSVV